MVIKRQIEINNSIGNVWQILGHDFANPYKWSSDVYYSEGQGKQLASIECDERSCKTSMGDIREKITHYSDENHTVSWDIVEGLPFFVSRAKSTWNLKRKSDKVTVLHIHMEMILKPWASIMAFMAKRMFNKLADNLSEDFAYYAENEKPHPRKIRVQQKQAVNSNLLSFYFIAFLLGTFIPLYFIANFIREQGGVHLLEFSNQLFANNAASTFSSDLLICSLIFWVFIIYENKIYKLPNALYFIALNLTIGLSSALPLYLFFRERRKNQTN